MDPNETLRIIRATIKQMRVDEHPDIRKAHADELAEHVEALDEWISKGGFLPEAWLPQPIDVQIRHIDGTPCEGPTFQVLGGGLVCDAHDRIVRRS